MWLYWRALSMSLIFLLEKIRGRPARPQSRYFCQICFDNSCLWRKNERNLFEADSKANHANHSFDCEFELNNEPFCLVSGTNFSSFLLTSAFLTFLIENLFYADRFKWSRFCYFVYFPNWWSETCFKWIIDCRFLSELKFVLFFPLSARIPSFKNQSKVCHVLIDLSGTVFDVFIFWTIFLVLLWCKFF